MADKKISQLPEGNITPETIFPIVTSGVTSQTTFADIQSAIGSTSGGTQTFQQVLENGNTSTIPFLHESVLGGFNIKSGIISAFNNGSSIIGQEINVNGLEGGFIKCGNVFGEGFGYFIESNILFGGTTGDTSFTYFGYPFDPEHIGKNYTLATTDDIKIGTTAPTSASDNGTVGEIRVAAEFIYWCTAPNTWIRASGTTW